MKEGLTLSEGNFNSLHLATLKDDPKEVLSEIAKGKDLEAKNDFGENVLLIAAGKNTRHFKKSCSQK